MYLAVEGIDTAGKSTQIDRLKALFPEAVFTREPGGTAIGERIRSIILETGVSSAKTELLLFLADRSEHVHEVIRPNRERLIVSDRSVISGLAYALGKQLFEPAELVRLNRFATDGLMPDIVIILELSEAELTRRLSAKTHDSIEARGIAYLLTIQNNMRTAAEALGIPARFIDASRPVENITNEIQTIIAKGAL